jgi:hypothetical protein
MPPRKRASLPHLLRQESALKLQLLLALPASPSSSIHSHLLHLYLHLCRLIPHLLKPCLTHRRPPHSSHNSAIVVLKLEIVAPAEGSKEAIVSSPNVADEASERLDQNFKDNYDGID